MNEREFYRTPDRRHGARAAGVDPRPGEDIDRGGQKTSTADPGGMKSTEPTPKIESNSIDPAKRRQEGADEHQPVRGNEPADGEGAGDPVARGERRPAKKNDAEDFRG